MNCKKCQSESLIMRPNAKNPSATELICAACGTWQKFIGKEEIRLFEIRHQKQVPAPTNADRIRSMSDEELAELIYSFEDLKAQLAKYDEVAAEYGIDGKTMLTLAKSQIRTAKDNVELQEQLATALEEAKKQHYLAFEMAGKADEYMRRERAERERGCEWCKVGRDNARTVWIDGSFDAFTGDSYGEGASHKGVIDRKVAYCPMCGRRLEVEP